MRDRRLGSSDPEVSEISLGPWLADGGGVPRNQAEARVARAFDEGINLVDTANVYGGGRAEELLGEVLAGRPREGYVLATKLYFPMSSTDRGLSRTASSATTSSRRSSGCGPSRTEPPCENAAASGVELGEDTLRAIVAALARGRPQPHPT